MSSFAFLAQPSMKKARARDALLDYATSKVGGNQS